jgi:transposase
VEANEKRREEYLDKIKGIDKNILVHIDESGVEETIAKEMCWSMRGQVVKGKKSGKYYMRTNIIAGYVNSKPIAPLIFKGSCNTELFNKWVEEFLLKELEPGQVVIMDNAAFHKSPKTEILIESVGCKLIFLPPYSPDLNPIEKFWANMKRWIREQIINFNNLYEAITAFFNIPTSS